MYIISNAPDIVSFAIVFFFPFDKINANILYCLMRTALPRFFSMYTNFVQFSSVSFCSHFLFFSLLSFVLTATWLCQLVTPSTPSHTGSLYLYVSFHNKIKLPKVRRGRVWGYPPFPATFLSPLSPPPLPPLFCSSSSLGWSEVRIRLADAVLPLPWSILSWFFPLNTLYYRSYYTLFPLLPLLDW